MTAACFGQNIYEDTAVENCLSNLLSSQIRRYVIDLYWDTVNQRFGPCPVEIPRANSSASEDFQSPSSTISSAILNQRQNTAGSTPTIVANATSATPTSISPVRVANDGSTIYQLGPYQCSNTLTLNSIAAVFSAYMQNTADTVNAKLLTWIFNIHLASTAQAPTVLRDEIPAGLLPNSSNLLSTTLSKFNNIIYTPATLTSDRSNLNSSWFRRSSPNQYPLPAYFNIEKQSSGVLTTADGWPDENYIQVVRGRRLLVGFGTIDSAMSGYNYSADAERIYPPNYLSRSQDVRFEANGQLANGCFYNANEYSPNQVNNSWAVSTINTINPPDLGDAADNLTTCGYSQLLNVTIDGVTADVNAMPYQDFGNNAIFSWAYNQPENDSSIGTGRNGDEFRCALMVSNNSYRGHWRTQYCTNRYRVACREGRSPYRWRISGYTVPYGVADGACTGNTTFDVPRTGLENTYLYNKILADSQTSPDLLDGIWINFNSLDREGCWVTTGVNGTCPYYQDASAVHSRQILIPSIAALIVLVLTVLTILAKCSANARSSRTRRKGDGGWDYEGIPS